MFEIPIHRNQRSENHSAGFLSTFYEKLTESDVLPTTSQATPDAFLQEFEKANQAGESAVVITLASQFSGTYQSAMISAGEYDNIYVVDSASAAMGSVIGTHAGPGAVVVAFFKKIRTIPGILL